VVIPTPLSIIVLTLNSQLKMVLRLENSILPSLSITLSPRSASPSLIKLQLSRRLPGPPQPDAEGILTDDGDSFSDSEDVVNDEQLSVPNAVQVDLRVRI
jgi:hypothetical protein